MFLPRLRGGGVTVPAPDTVRIYQDSLGEWRWIRRTPTGRTVNESAAGFPTRGAANADNSFWNQDTLNYLLEQART